jgi:predicted neutral ceramidase superfamily lipid hydrolase
MARSKDPEKYSALFSKRLPELPYLFAALLAMSIIIGMAAVSILHLRFLPSRFINYIFVNGTLAGMIAILLPTVLTAVVIKAARPRLRIKHSIFISIIGSFSYSIFILLGSLLHLFFGLPIATVVILVGDASLFGWWFFINKVVLGFGKRAILFALVQPTLNVILFIAASRFIFRFDTPFNILILKLYAGIFIFMIASYLLLYIFDRPLKKHLDVGTVDMFSGMLQNWLFDINTAISFNTKHRLTPDIETDTIVIKRRNGKIKSIFFAPQIHYGPAGSLGASNFPSMLEEFVNKRYKAVAFIMHGAVTADRNPISASQFGSVKRALVEGIEKARDAGNGIRMEIGKYSSAKVTRLSLGGVSFAFFTRAPRITEDISYECAELFRKKLSNDGIAPILIDSHNSRFESAPKSELVGVKYGSTSMNEYMRAIAGLHVEHRSARIKAGMADLGLYEALGEPSDLAKGNLNAAVFSFGKLKYMMLHFNSNNMLPSMRESIISHIRKKHGIVAEVYTTDTHAVNSIERTVENVFGRETKFNRIAPHIDSIVEKALADLEEVKILHSKVIMKKFPVWGPDVGDMVIELTKSVIADARLMGPIVVLAGFIFAALAISII